MESVNGFAQTATIEKIQDRLNEEKTVQAIDRLLDRIESLEKAVANLTTMMEQAPGLLAMTTDAADEAYQKAAARGVNIEKRLSVALQMAEKLTAPAMVEKLDSLLGLAEQAPGLLAMTMDAADEAYRKAAARGVNIENRLGFALQMAEKLTAPAMVEKLDNLLELTEQAPGLLAMMMDIFDEEARKACAKGLDINAIPEVTNQILTAVTKAKQMPEAKVGGFFSMMRTMRDPDRQVAIGYLMNIAKALGQELKK